MRWKVLASLFFSEVGWYGRILYVRTLITRTRPRAAERRSSNVWAGSHLQMVESRLLIRSQVANYSGKIHVMIPPVHGQTFFREANMYIMFSSTVWQWSTVPVVVPGTPKPSPLLVVYWVCVVHLQNGQIGNRTCFVAVPLDVLSILGAVMQSKGLLDPNRSIVAPFRVIF